jgi:hypothetical protein
MKNRMGMVSGCFFWIYLATPSGTFHSLLEQEIFGNGYNGDGRKKRSSKLI